MWARRSHTIVDRADTSKIRRRREAMRSAISYSESPKPTRGEPPSGFDLIKAPLPTSGRGFVACISSRITTVIQVGSDDLRNINWFNEPFAVSLCLEFVLRHAWLNLRDKHMTTGRINQVTNVSRCDTSGCLRGEHAIVSKDC